MALPGSSGGLGNYHADVLNATPIGSDAIGRLTEEIKGRAAGSIKNGNYPEAISLYSKAIEVQQQQQQGSESVIAILHANRSMCHLKMGNAVLAHQDAETAIASDANYLKGYYRCGVSLVALKQFSKAREILRAGLALKPDDRELREQLDKLVGMDESTPAPVPPATGSGAIKTAGSNSGNSTSKSASGVVATSAADKDDGEIDGVFRGYKKTSDGRITTFFNNELDAATRELIGDIAPKKLEAEAAVSAALPASNGSGGSAWNAAGTFESVNWTKWATGRLKELLLEVAVTPEAACAVTVTEVKLEGDAEIVSNRGKVKRIYDFSLTLKWRLTTGEPSLAATGVMEVRDVTADEDYEVGDCKADDGITSPVLQELVRKHIKSSSGALQLALFAALHTFAEEFKSKV